MAYLDYVIRLITVTEKTTSPRSVNDSSTVAVVMMNPEPHSGV